MSEASEVSEPAQGRPDSWLFALRVRDGRYAFEAALVSEVVTLGPVTRLPASPPFLLGVFMHRGEVLPVLDVNQLLGQAAVALAPTTRAAVIHSDPWRVAIVAEQVVGLLPDVRDSFDTLPAGEKSGSASEYLVAVAHDSEGDLAVIDLGRLIATARSRSLGE